MLISDEHKIYNLQNVKKILILKIEKNAKNEATSRHIHFFQS